MDEITVGCSAPLGQGGLGSHLEFVYRAVLKSGRHAQVLCRSRNEDQESDTVFIPKEMWTKWIPYTPLRWMPSKQVFMDSLQFDRTVSGKLSDRPRIYHSFPGFAEDSFYKNKKNGGINILEAATTHVEELFSLTEEEHKKLGIGGSPYSKAWVKRVIREYELADYITIASTLQLDSFLQQGIQREKLLFAPLGVDVQRFSPKADQPSVTARGKDEPFRIIQVGQVSVRKGFMYLLEAVTKLQDPNIEIILYGGIGWRSIRQLIDSYRRRGLNIRLGAGDPVPVLRQAHLCVHSAIEDGFGLAPLEAMAAGLPTIVTESTGMRDAIQDGISGLIIPVRNTDVLARCIAEIKENDDYRIALGKASRLAALNYDLQDRVSKYANVLEPIWKSGVG